MATSFFNRKASFLMAAILLILSARWAGAQTTEFTYQGRLTDGDNPADSIYDFEFKLFDALADGSQQGSTVQLLNVEVVRGVFTGADRYLEISLRPTARDRVVKESLLFRAPANLSRLNKSQVSVTTNYESSILSGPTG
ncbi:MAG TPA: hypothetical protein VF131_15430 [Blastocatellia bacterium]|nr:hypothetical protein [Blastocatellia bacterium]